ncbi:MAG: DMT family transporter [Ktedonobacterales bacterium]
MVDTSVREVAACAVRRANGRAATAVARPAVPVSRARLYLALAFGVMCIGLSAIFTKWTQLPGSVSAYYRVAIAELALLPLFVVSARRGQVRLDRRAWLIALAAGVFFALDLGLWNTSLGFASAANATLLGNDAPLVVGLIAFFIFRERLGVAYWLGLSVALVGMGIIVGQDALGGAHGLGLGDALALLGGCAYALYMVTTQRVRAHMNTVASLWIPGLAGGALLLAFNLISGQALWGFSGRTWLTLLGLALISQVAGWLAINWALGHLSASVVSVTLLAQPVLTALFAVPLLGEGLSGRQILGGLVALAGIYLVNRAAIRRTATDAPLPLKESPAVAGEHKELKEHVATWS